jgi:hypothetical protein|tara:strand:- start:2237 stop:2452 length:216 start_codon:yes stop_codon:yes gene_type:complete
MEETVLFKDKIWKFSIAMHEEKYVFFAKYIPSFINSGWKFFDDLKSCKTFADEYIISYKENQSKPMLQNHQ